MKAALPILLALAVVARAAGELLHFEEPHMGTLFRIELHAEDAAAAGRAAQEAFARIGEINQAASDYLPESELSRFNKAPAGKPVKVGDDLFALLQKSGETSQLTDGAFDITCAYAVQNWRRAKRQHRLPSAEQTAHAIAMTDWRALVLDPTHRTALKNREGILADLGGIGKGYAAHQALLVLRRHGFERALVAGSGDIAIGDPPPGADGWDVALRTFEGPEERDPLVHLTLRNCGLSTSGDLHQFLEIGGARYSHIIDPKTGLGLTRRIACTVIAPTAADSDALDTPMAVMGPVRGLSLLRHLPGHAARFVTWDGNERVVTASPGFPTASR